MPSLRIHIGFAALLLMCSCAEKKLSKLEILKEYEGLYTYSNPSTLSMAASDYDTTLYAVLDEAKYPLRFISPDTFENSTKDLVIFQRNKNGKIEGYRVNGEPFSRLKDDSTIYHWIPRKELFSQPDQYTYQIPEEKNDGIPVGDLKQAFQNPEAIISMVRETIKGKYPDVHSILIYKDGKLVLEEYFYEYDADKPHQLRSASKSFIGTLMGIAIDQGKIKSENEKLIPLFRGTYDTIKNMDDRKARITIKDFLTYRHGMDCNDEDPETKGHEEKMMKSPDWIQFTLDLPMVEEPGKRSAYCTACAQTIGKLVELKVGTPLVEYADKNLFAPLGITNYKWRFSPDPSSEGTFNQMYLRPRDMLKLGMMYHHNGKWDGQQIVSENWIKKTFEKDDVEFGYLWRHKAFDVDGKVYNSYLATGNGGQKINIWPEQNMITVFTGGNYNAYAVYGRQTPPNEMIPEFILKAIGKSGR
jgi:CubicO group peptidase (beta-lactamase class C family)